MYDKDFPLEKIIDEFMGMDCYDFYHFKYKEYNCFTKKVKVNLPGFPDGFYYCSYLAIPIDDKILQLDIEKLGNWNCGCTWKEKVEEFMIFGDDYAHYSDMKQYRTQEDVVLNLQSVIEEMLLLQRSVKEDKEIN